MFFPMISATRHRQNSDWADLNLPWSLSPDNIEDAPSLFSHSSRCKSEIPQWPKRLTDGLPVLADYESMLIKMLIVDDSRWMNDSTLFSEKKELLGGSSGGRGSLREQLLDAKTAVDIYKLFQQVKLTERLTPVTTKLEEFLLNQLTDLEKLSSKRRSCPRNCLMPKLTRTIADKPLDLRIVKAAARLKNGKCLLCKIGIQLVLIGSPPATSKYLKDLDHALVDKHETQMT
ncbi:hypothetical protein C8J56DRAFT_1160500 [Mycena floridula]|nr:hypothetical protein C8J56DRAFT_1160500 [Mycena floridula]